MNLEERSLYVSRALGLADQLATTASHLELLAITARECGITVAYQPGGGHWSVTLDSVATDLTKIRRALLEEAAKCTLEAEEEGCVLPLDQGPGDGAA